MKSPFHRFRSVRRKLFAATLLSSLVALLVAGGGLFLFDLHTHRAASVADLRVEAEILGNTTSAALQFEDPVVAARNLSFLSARSAIRTAAIYDPRGHIFATYARAATRASWPPIAPPPGESIEADRVRLLHRIAAGPDALGYVFLEADLNTGARIASYAAIALVVTGVALAVAMLLSALLQSGITGPILQISDLAHQVVAKRDYSVRATRTTNDELARLVDAFNEMLTEIQARNAALEASRDEVARLNEYLERRVQERTLQLAESNERLKAADLEKSRFLSMMSHEIRTPMNGVLGMLELLTLKELNPEQKATVAIVRESGRSLLRIIDDILDFSRIEAGKLEVRPEPASVERIVASVVGVYSGNASSKGIILRSGVDPRISPAVRVDPLRLRQILNNLVSNAIKFTAQGSVELRADLVDRGEEVDIVCFRVTDTGIGVSREAQARLFEPFSQAGGEVERVFGGSGLGLSIARRLATLLGGTLEMESEIGKGSTMLLELPLPQADPSTLRDTAAAEAGALREVVLGRRSAPPAEQAVREGSLVLVVDDHPVNRLLLMGQVTALGYAAEEAADGREALEKWRSGRYRLVITDCNMPEMDGYELAMAMREIERGGRYARTAIIACTANALQGEAEKCFAAGMDDYVAKPVELVQLLEKLDTWLPIPHDTPPVDLEVLARSSVRGEAMRKEAFKRFREFNDADVHALLGAIDSRDLAQAIQVAHRVKGASRSLGANPLADTCHRIEYAARNGDWTSVTANRGALLHEVNRLNDYLDTASGVA